MDLKVWALGVALVPSGKSHVSNTRRSAPKACILRTLTNNILAPHPLLEYFY